jgi:hypothetical protein
MINFHAAKLVQHSPDALLETFSTFARVRRPSGRRPRKESTMKTMDEKIRAAEMMLGALLGARGTQEKIPTAVEQACPGWTENEQEDALVIAAHLAFTRGLSRGWDLTAGQYGVYDYVLAFFVHDILVSEELEAYLGRRDDLDDTRDSALEILLPHPWIKGLSPTNKERAIVPRMWRPFVIVEGFAPPVLLDCERWGHKALARLLRYHGRRNKRPRGLGLVSRHSQA